MTQVTNRNPQPPHGVRCTTRRGHLKSLLTGSAVALPLVWHKPMVNAVLMPAHAQTSIRSFPIVDSLHQVAQLFTEDRLPSGSVTTVESIGRVRFRGCRLPPNASISVNAFIERAVGADLALLTDSFTAAGSGNYTHTVVIGTQPILPITDVTGIRVEMIINGEVFNYSLSQSDVNDAVNGTTPALTC